MTTHTWIQYVDDCLDIFAEASSAQMQYMKLTFKTVATCSPCGMNDAYAEFARNERQMHEHQINPQHKKPFTCMHSEVNSWLPL